MLRLQKQDIKVPTIFFKWFRTLYGLLAVSMTLGVFCIRKRKLRIPESELPTVAVIIACRNEAKNLPELLASLAVQDYPANKVSFWIVDDESTDQSAQIVSQMAQRDSRFQAIRSDPSFSIPSPKKRALHQAIQLTDAEWIVTTDADCTPPSGWLKSLMNYTRPEIGVIVGYSPLKGAKDPIQWLIVGESWSAAALAAAGIGLGFPFNAVGRNFAFRRQIFHDVEGYGRDALLASGDDDLFMQRVVSRTDWRVAFADDPHSYVPAKVPQRRESIEAKIRHISVGTHYAPGWVLIGTIGSVLFMGLALYTVLSWLGLADRRTAKKAWGWKWLFDLGMMFAALRIIPDAPRALTALATMTIAPFAFWYLWYKALFGTVVWKGRTFRRGRAIL